MRMLLYFLPIALLLAANAASGGQEELSVPITSAEAVASAKDDQPVRLRGKIVSWQSRNHYVFADDSGNTVVKISRRVRDGGPLLPGMTVEIHGEVDTSANRVPKVEAKSVTVLAGKDTWSERAGTPQPQPEAAKP
jgi:uncharacterized protein (TIGR00156 family)